MKNSPQRVAFAAALLSLSPTLVWAQTTDQASTIRETLHLTSFTTQELIIPELDDAEMAVEIVIDGQPLTMVMRRHSLRAADFHLLVSDGSGAPVRIEAPKPTTVRGEILELEGSVIVGGLIEGQLNAEISYQGLQWAIQPLTAAIPTALSNQYVVYNAAAVTTTEGVCGVNASHYLPSQTGGTLNLGSGQRICEIAIECDTGYYNSNGSSIQNTINDTELIMNRMDNIYDSDADTRFMITTIHIWTSNTPYSGDLGARLDQFRSYWNSNFGFIKKDLAHYMVGGSTGGVIGVAWVGAVCTNSRYGVSRTKFSTNLVQRTALTAHEVGHNYNSGHCSGSSCTIMCASIGGCGGPLTHFGSSSANTIRNYSFGRTCTPENGPHLTAPWTDNFESNSINSDTWPAQQGASTSTAATGETSGSRSLNLDGGNGTPEGQDRIISNYTLLQGQSALFATYNTQHKGVGLGGSLLVEYRQDSGGWAELNTVVSDGNNQSSFDSHSHALPADAYHNEFQLRFISENGGGTSSDWYIDDVSVSSDGGTTCTAPSNYCFASPNSVGSGMTLTASGTSSFAANDLSLLAVGGPPNKVGLFFMGLNQSASIFGDGLLCVTGGILRYSLVQIDVFSTASLVVDYNTAPAAVNMLPGTTWNFQFWYRDPGAGGSGFNTSDAVEVNVCD